MLNGRDLVVDTFSEVSDLLAPYITHEFWDFASHDVRPGAVYVIGREQFRKNLSKIRDIIEQDRATVVFDNAAEGSWTMINHLHAYGIDDLARQKKLLLIGGGDIEDSYAHIRYDHFLTKIVQFEENHVIAEQVKDSLYTRRHRPYHFLYLNGRSRQHRRYLFERIKKRGLLEHSLYSMLDSSAPKMSPDFYIFENGINILETPTEIKTLPKKYEVDRYQNFSADDTKQGFVKHEIFNNEWGEIYLAPSHYTDTYFSLVCETVGKYPYSFRTEKIAKPLMIGHPWICATGRGFYRDLRELGFRTFSGLVDERFDDIDHNPTRMDYIVDVVEDICNQGLDDFVEACKDICKYNQQRLQEIVPEIRSRFVSDFFNLIGKYARS